MATNPFFENYIATSEQNLLEDLVIESIQTYGQDMYYLPRRHTNLDKLTYSDDQSYFDTFYCVEFYIKSVDGFGGDKTFMSKFDIEIRDQLILTIARRRFEEEIGHKEGFLAPREGDLLYFPMNGKLFQIMFADNKPTFYQLGNLQTFDVTVEVFEFSSERFQTGLPFIDVYNKFSQDILSYALVDEHGSPLISEEGDVVIAANEYYELINNDHVDDNEDIAQQIADESIILFTETNPFAEKNY